MFLFVSKIILPIIDQLTSKCASSIKRKIGFFYGFKNCIVEYV